jgi:hypothetical protein
VGDNITNTKNIHLSDSSTRRRTKKVENSPSFIAEHVKTNEHPIDWKNFRVLLRDNMVYHLSIKDLLIITIHEPQLNRTAKSRLLLVFPERLEPHLSQDSNRKVIAMKCDQNEQRSKETKISKKDMSRWVTPIEREDTNSRP